MTPGTATGSTTTTVGADNDGRPPPPPVSLVTFLPAQESDPPVGAGPDNPSGRMPENLRRGNPSSRESQPAGLPENSKRKKLFSYRPTGGRQETDS